MSEGIRRRRLDAPEPMDEANAGRDARIRYKFDRGEPLSEDEVRLLANLPAGKEIPPGAVREAARRAGGEEPIDATTGRVHDLDEHAKSDASTALNPPAGRGGRYAKDVG